MNKRSIIMTIYLATFVIAIESTIVVTASNEITKDLGGTESISLIFSSYLFSVAIATQIFSKLSDYYGKKIIFQLGLVIFLIGTLLCGFATNVGSLIAYRILQGIGAGAIMPMTFALIGEFFSIKMRGKIIGLNNTAWGIASLVAPLIGGFLVQFLSWRWIFWVNIPFVLIILVITIISYPKMYGVKNAKSNFSQYLFMSFSLVLILLSLEILNNFFILGFLLFFISLIILWLFYKFEKNHSGALIPIENLKNKSFLLFIIIIFSVNGLLIGFQVYIPLWVQTELSMTPTLAGLVLFPSSIFYILGSYFSDFFSRKLDIKYLMITILVTMCFIFFILSILQGNTKYLVLLFISSILGLVFGVITTISMVSAQSFASKENLGSVSGFITLCRTLGQSFIITFLGMINQYILNNDGDNLSSYHGVFFFSSVFSLFLLSMILKQYKKYSF